MTRSNTDLGEGHRQRVWGTVLVQELVHTRHQTALQAEAMQRSVRVPHPSTENGLPPQHVVLQWSRGLVA
jgi:hypothetical protein